MIRYLTLFILFPILSLAQTRLVIVGKVVDSGTKKPLSFATIGLKRGNEQTISRSDGSFELRAPESALRDTLTVTYLGYETWSAAVSSLESIHIVNLRESPTLLNEVTITSRKFDAREVDRSLQPIRGSLYAMSAEVTNAQYNMFLDWLEDHNQQARRKEFDYNLSAFNKADAEFFRRYAAGRSVVVGKNDPAANDNGGYPAVNITWAGAAAYCSWLTDRYNEAEKKKKFKKVVFRLPTHDEWRIAALGDKNFQSWKFDENLIDVAVNDDTLAMLPKKGKKVRISVNDDVRYPWWATWHYRNKPQNHLNCWLGNFLVVDPARLCPARNPAFDGWSMMARVESYFPNNFGLYDMVGNVAEMNNEDGRACGGSWNDPPEESTIQSVKNYRPADKTVGFRVFMEVVEP
jgi:formylglycine-generating enzyme required for sulfatase activity